MAVDKDVKEIRDEFADATTQLADIRDEGATDMRYIAGDPWEPEDRRAREDAGRPCLTSDELGQYVNQVINDIRANKRSVKVAPVGAGATDKTAELRQNLIRQIEYRSNAQTDAYPVLFENALQRSYGYLRIVPERTAILSGAPNPSWFDQELRIRAIPNPDMVTEDPYSVRSDGSDWKFLYFRESWRQQEFKRKFPSAKRTNFGAFAEDAKGWVTGDRIMVAERWRVVTKARKLLLVQPPQAGQPYAAFEDELDLASLPEGVTIARDETIDMPSVKKQITNGLEILEETDFPGVSIPFVPCYGKILYFDDGGGPKRVILSLVRLARDPYMLYCYYRTCEMELIGMTPKTPYMAYEGQFSPEQLIEVQKSLHEPVAVLFAKAKIDGLQGDGPLPLPQRQTFEPPIQALELGAEAARRGIQAAMGSSMLPTQAQRRNEKSGVALKQIEDSAQRGSFHFVDHFDAALMRTGAILDELIPHYYDAAREVTVRKADDQPAQIRINNPQDPEAVSATDGQHDVTISVGPREASEREAASDFADTLIGSQLIQMMPPPLALKVVALAIRLKSVGPIGDAIADLLSPKDADSQSVPPQALQAQLQALGAKLQEAQQALQTDQIKIDGQIAIKKLELDSQERRAAMDRETKLAVAELGAKVDRMTLFLEERARIGLQAQAAAHEAAENAADRAHEVGLTAMDAEHARQGADQAHGQALEQSAQGHANAIEQAAIPPAPAAG